MLKDASLKHHAMTDSDEHDVALAAPMLAAGTVAVKLLYIEDVLGNSAEWEGVSGL